MIFFGWGRKAKSQHISPEQALVLAYTYFHFFWLFRITVPGDYSIATLTPAGWANRPLTVDEAAGARGDLSIHWWWRWGLAILGVPLLAIFILALAIPVE